MANFVKQDGKDAFTKGVFVEHNPYDLIENPEAFMEWHLGWMESFELSRARSQVSRFFTVSCYGVGFMVFWFAIFMWGM